MKNYFIKTFGCQMNISDSERIAKKLEEQGHKPIKADSSAEALAKADLIVINACSVRQSAMNRAYAQIHRHYKDKKVILTGCILESDRKKLKEKVSEFWHPDKYFNCSALRSNKNIAYVPIMTGCNNFCAYCVVPYTRGREKSRKTDDILKEVKNLVKKGYKEIFLLGQNVNSYHGTHNIKHGTKFINFSDLLKKINAIPGNFRISFLTSHPKDMSDKLIETIAKSKKVSDSIHLPVQSGDDEILHKMNRRYSSAHFKRLIKKIRSAFKKHRNSLPEISTDIIVGFPGETKNQFQNTLKLCKEINFDKAYVAKYSPRPGTAAAKLKDNVPFQEKKRRWRILDNLINKK